MTDKEKDDLIISRPQALSAVRKGTEMTSTLAGWFIWAVLCRPLFLVFLWFLGVRIFYEHMIRLRGVSSFENFAFTYAVVIFFFYVMIRGWNSYNIWKFRGKERRVMNAPVSSEDLERFFKLPPKTVEKAQSWKDITVDVQGDGQIVLKETV